MCLSYSPTIQSSKIVHFKLSDSKLGTFTLSDKLIFLLSNLKHVIISNFIFFQISLGWSIHSGILENYWRISEQIKASEGVKRSVGLSDSSDVLFLTSQGHNITFQPFAKIPKSATI